MREKLLLAGTLIASLALLSACAQFDTELLSPEKQPQTQQGAPIQNDISMSEEASNPFEIKSLTISPARIGPGDMAIITATIVNTGNSDEIYTANLQIDNVIEEERKLSIPTGELITLMFQVSRVKPGIYTAKLGNISGKFEVVAPANQNTTPRAPGVPSCCG